MADRDDLTASFLAFVDEAFRRLLDEPDAHLCIDLGFDPEGCGRLASR